MKKIMVDMKKIKTLHKFKDANIDGEKLEKANKNIENALRKGDIKVKEEFKGEIIKKDRSILVHNSSEKF